MTLYTLPTCINCESVKELLKQHNLLDKCEIKNAKEPIHKKELMKRGYMSVPLLIIGDKEILGYDKDKIELAIKEELND